MLASYTKLRDGSWGIRVQGSAKAGQVVVVRKKDNTSKDETIERVLWTGDGISLCSIGRSQQTRASNSRGGQQGSLRGRRTGCACGSIEGEYHPWYCESCRFEELDQ